MEQFLTRICSILQEMFFKGYGDYRDSVSGDFSLPNSSAWSTVVSMSTPCILMLKNTDAANEIQITWNSDAAIGFRISAGVSVVLDGVVGVLYAKCTSGTAVLNYATAAVKTNS